VLLGAGYALHRNVSNSYSETVTRHAITGRVAAALPWELFLTARADLVLAYYAQAVLVVPNTTMPMPGSDHASIEEENRSTVRGELSRAISDRVQIIARYTYYAPPLTGSMVSYNRHTALLSLAFTLER
jgi:hypothetical protein